MTFVAIHSYGKVCSTSLKACLPELLDEEVFYSHGIADRSIDVARAYLAMSPNPAVSELMLEAIRLKARVADAMRTGEQIILVSGVRDPIARSLSAVMQNLHHTHPDILDLAPEDAANRLREHLRRHWRLVLEGGDPRADLESWWITAPLFWFQDEIEAPFGFDLATIDFDFANGYHVARHNNVTLFVFQTEKAPGAINQGLATLFPGKQFDVPRENAGDDKAYVAIYDRLKGSFTLDRDLLAKIYDNPYVARFYNADQRTAFTEKWADRQAAVAVSGETGVRATILIPLLNNERFVAEQIESLSAQWRDDLELLVIDDGSGDAGSEAVRSALAGKDHIRATVMRNPRTLGLDGLPTMLSLARGEVIIQADSDDIALPGRIDAILDRFATDPHCRLVTSNALVLDDAGMPVDLNDTDIADDITAGPERWARQSVYSRQWLGASAAYHRTVLESFPPIDSALCPYGLDLVTAFRATLLGTHHYIAEPLVGWRQHGRNSHRVAGAGDPEAASAERYVAMELMALAQRRRDLDAVAPGDPHHAATRALCHQAFDERFDEWSRLRNRLSGQHKDRPLEASAKGRTAMPPVVTLAPGHWPFGAGTMLGAAAARWSGFHQPEVDGNWTSRSALLVIRAQADTVLLRLRGLSAVQAERFRLSVNLGRSQEIALEFDRDAEIRLPVGESPVPGHIVLTMHAPDAVAPTALGGEDQRTLGVKLKSLELIGAAKA